MNESINKILQIAINAPSGSNSQPWRFKVFDDEIDIIALPEKDHPVLNFRNRGTWIAHGALLENIIILLTEMNYQFDVKMFPDPRDLNVTARISLKKSSSKNLLSSSLCHAISKRTTNRKAYCVDALTEEQKIDFRKSVDEVGGGAQLIFVEDREEIRMLAEAGAVNEIITLENQELHKLFFDEIAWNKNEENNKKGGLYLKTMELSFFKRFALRIFRYWPVMNFFNRLHIARRIAEDNAKIYASCSAMGAIIVKGSDSDFLIAGRLMERLWLKTTVWNLSFHIITGVLFLNQKIEAGERDQFSKDHINLIIHAYNRIASIFRSGDGVVAIMFRVGSGGEPTARSMKLPPVIISPLQ